MFAGSLPGDSRFTPVIMLTAAVNALERLFMKQAGKAMPLGNGAHGLHNQMIVVAGDVGDFIYGGEFMLRGRGFVMFCFRGNAKLPQMFV